MDHHRQLHHQHHHNHHPPPRQHHPQLMDSPRYLQLHPPPPPPLSFPDDYPPHRHLPPPPPPPQHRNLSPHPLPHPHAPPPRLIHHPPPPPHSFSSHPHQKPCDDPLVNSPPHHHHHHYHHHQLQHHPPPHHQFQHLQDDHRDVFRSPTRVIPPNRILGFENHNHNMEDEIERRPRFRLNELPPPPHPPLPPPSRVPPHSPIARRSPPFVQFERFRRQIDSPPRFREDVNLEPRARLHPDAIDFHQLHRDRIDDRRISGVVDRLDTDFDRDHHERYLPEMVPRKDFELNFGDDGLRGSLDDEVFIRGGRDDAVLEENMNMRRSSGGGGGSREVSRSPIKFRTGGIKADDGFSDQGTPRKNVQKKSAFLRIQPAKQPHNSSFRNRFDCTSSSPRKGKESNSESVDCRTIEERVGSPVELDVSFKSNALVAKAIMATPSCSDVDLGTKLDGECPSKVVSFKINSSISKREGKACKNRVRVSPIMKRLGNQNNVQARDNTCKTSPKDEVLCKGDRNIGSQKISSSSSVRTKRKAISPLSRLSSPVPTKTNNEIVNVDSPANHTSDDSMTSDISVNQSGKELSCVGNVIGSTQNVHESSTVGHLEEVLRESVSEGSAAKRLRENGLMKSFPDSPGSRGPSVSKGHVNHKGNLQGEQKISDPYRDVTIFVEKCSSDTHIENKHVMGQDMAPVFSDNGSMEGTSEAVVVCMGDNVNNNDVGCENVDTLNSAAVTSSITIPLDASNKREYGVNLTCPVVNADKPCETLVFSSHEISADGLSLGGMYPNRNNELELLHSEDSENVESFSIDVSSDKSRTSLKNDDDVTICSKNVTHVSHVAVNNVNQEQQCQDSGTTLVIDELTLEREGFPEKCIYAGDVLAFSEKEGSSQLNKKRKVRTESNSLDIRMSDFCHESPLHASFPIDNARLPVKEHFPAVTGSSSVKSDVSHGNEFTGSCAKCIDSVNHICDIHPIEYKSSCDKKRKILPSKAVFSDVLGSENSDFIPIADGSSVQCSAQLSKELAQPCSVRSAKDIVAGATSTSCAETCSFADVKSDPLCKDSCLSVAETAPLDAEQSYFLESGCNQMIDVIQKIDGKLMMAGANEENGFIALESACRMASNDSSGAADDTEDADQGPLVINMECNDTIAQKSMMSSPSDCPQSCAEFACGVVSTDSDMLHILSNVGTLGAQSAFSPTMGTSNVTPGIPGSSDEKPSIDEKKPDQHLATQRPFTSQSNVLNENRKNIKLSVSASTDVQPSTQKSVALLPKHVKTMPGPISTNRLRRNVLTRSEASPSTNCRSSVTNPSNKAQTYPAKPRTWHRTNNLAASNIPVKKPSVIVSPPQRPLYGKALKVQDTSYIRKGNSLVRNPASGVATLGSRTFGASIDRSKPNDTVRSRNMGGSVMSEPTELSDGLVTGGRSALIEMPKTPPLLSSGKTSDNDIAYSGECTSSLPVCKSEGTDNQEELATSDAPLNSFRDSESVIDRNLEDPGMFSDGDLLPSNSKRMIYIKSKSNQLIAASNTSQSFMRSMDNKVASSSENYYKRRKHQLIRASSEGNLRQMVAGIEESSKSFSQRALHTYSGRSSNKRLSNKVKSSKRSLVWKLGDSKSCAKGIDALRSGRLLSHLLPWKRATYWSRKLLSTKKRGVVYVRSGRGFSLRRSKVISLPGTSLKWSKSMEKRSKKVDQEAAMAVAAMDSVLKSGSTCVSPKPESTLPLLQKIGHGLKLHSGERIFRIGVFRYRMDPSRRTLQRISDEETDFTASRSEKDARNTYVPKRLLIGSDEYVRIGNGNQLVRDPKRRTRILASEKVRWSLHTARMRLAKKRKFCQFFTRFGKCNKSEGKCPFIHDPSKIVVCTKFLNGLCADLNCKLTHKVIPERMPDCSFFLQGLCSNEKCPYRHVNVNPKASICESFLRGYCAEGNECRKKHSYICPEFEASGSCPQGSKCKLYHPKNGKVKRRKVRRDQKNAKGRYFGSGLSVDHETRPTFEKQVESNKGSVISQEEMGDFISLDVSDDEARENEQTLFEDDPLNSQLDDLDELIKPLRILGRL